MFGRPAQPLLPPKTERVRLTLRPRLELLESRTLLSSGVAAPNGPIGEPLPPPNATNFPALFDHSLPWGNSSESAFSHNFARANNSVDQHSLVGAELLDWQDARRANNDLPRWTSGDGDARSQNQFAGPRPVAAFARGNDERSNSGDLGGVDNRVFGDGVLEHGDGRANQGEFGAQPPGNWVNGADGFGQDPRGVQRLSRGASALPTVIVPPASERATETGVVKSPDLIQSARTNLRAPDAETATIRSVPTASVASEFSDSGGIVIDDGWPINTDVSLTTSIAASHDRSADAGSPAPAKSSSAASTLLAVARDIAAAGAFAVALSPPISRLLAPTGSLAAQGGDASPLGAFWTWLRWRKARRMNTQDDVADETEPNYETIDAAILASLESAFDRAFDAIARRRSLPAVSAACATATAAFMTFWRQPDQPLTQRRRSRRQEPTRVQGR